MESGNDHQPVPAPRDVHAVWMGSCYVDRVGMRIQQRHPPPTADLLIRGRVEGPGPRSSGDPFFGGRCLLAHLGGATSQAAHAAAPCSDAYRSVVHAQCIDKVQARSAHDRSTLLTY